MENRGESAAWIGGQLDVIGLGCRRSARRVFVGVNFQVSNGEALIAVGPNGAGKSSLLRLLAGLLQLDSGAILWNGRDITLDAQGHRARVA